MVDKETPSVEEQLANMFLAHPRTKGMGKVQVLEYNTWRSFRYAMDPGETLEISNHSNGPVTMKLIRFIDEGDNIYLTKVKIIDRQHGASSPGRITEIDYLKEVLKVLDIERKGKI